MSSETTLEKKNDQDKKQQKNLQDNSVSMPEIGTSGTVSKTSNSLIGSSVGGGISAILYSTGILSPLIWASAGFYAPAILAGFISSFFTGSDVKNRYEAGALSGLISLIPVYVGVFILGTQITLSSSIILTVLMMTITSCILGMIGASLGQILGFGNSESQFGY